MMGVLRLLILLAVGYLLYRLFLGRKRLDDAVTGPDAAPGGALRRCTTCGTLIPVDMVLLRDGKPYCGPKCAGDRREGPSD